MSVETIILLCVVAMIGGLGLLLLGGRILSLMQGAKSARWPTVEGRVITSRVEEKRTQLAAANEGQVVDEVGWQPVVEYEFRVEGMFYKGTKISPVDKQYTQKIARKVVDRYPVGGTVKVFADPANPNDAFLEPGTAKSSLVFLLGGLLLLGAAAALAGSIAY